MEEEEFQQFLWKCRPIHQRISITRERQRAENVFFFVLTDQRLPYSDSTTILRCDIPVVLVEQAILKVVCRQNTSLLLRILLHKTASLDFKFHNH